jgi:hypothetical protein
MDTMVRVGSFILKLGVKSASLKALESIIELSSQWKMRLVNSKRIAFAMAAMLLILLLIANLNYLH